MSERITNANLERRAEAVNRGLRDGIYVVVEGRYGYTALDLYDKRGCIRTLTTGKTKREVYDYMGAMIETLTIIGRDV